MQVRPIPLIVGMHAEDAAVLWLQRDRAVDAPHFNPELLLRLEERLEANVDGLREAGKAGWEAALASMQAFLEPGEVFTAAVLALESRDPGKIDAVISVTEAVPATSRAFISALGWVGAPLLRGTVSEFLADSRPHRRMLGVAACSVHRVDPGALFPRLLQDHEVVQARALRLTGELGRSDFRRVVSEMINVEGSCGFWAAWSAGLLGDRHAAIEALKRYAEGPKSFRARALQLLLRITGGPAAVSWLRELARNPANATLLVTGAGILGDPSYIPWLLRCMEDPALARAAGESFAMITGVDIAHENLEGEAPSSATSGPNDDPKDPNVDLDPDEHLPWPQPELLRLWWETWPGRNREGSRLFRGKDISDALLQTIFETGFQRQRRAAALELAVRSSSRGLANWRKPLKLRQKNVG